MINPASSIIFIVVLMLFLAGTEYAYRALDPNSRWPDILIVICMVGLFVSVLWMTIVY